MCFIKENVTRSVDTTRKRVKTTITLYRGVIANENTRVRMRLEFVLSVWTKPRKATTPKERRN